MKIVFVVALLAVVALSSLSAAKAEESPTIPEAPAPACDPHNCKLPDCHCSSILSPIIPGLPRPQVVYLTFDDAITLANRELYDRLFTGRKNPNGQSISATFFVSHEYNDYELTHSLWRQGHEIALHSISHKANMSYWKSLTYEEWVKEAAEQRLMTSHFAAIPIQDIRGFRPPTLQGGGDAMYRALREGGFRYESSRSTQRYRPCLFPYTADYASIQECQIEPCPTGSHPGFWVSPLLDLIGSNGYPCRMVDTCLDPPQSAQAAYNLLMTNFRQHYEGMRAPFGVYTHAAWILNPEAPWIEEGYLKFIDEILSLNDTFIVSISKGLDWMQSPVSLLPGGDFSNLPYSWKPAGEKPNRCTFPTSCEFRAAAGQLPPGMTGSRYMRTCPLCPPYYPWVGNPLGEDPY